MKAFDAVMMIEGEGTYTEAEMLRAWAYLIKTGMAWRLQGFYGRQASDLIERGIISKTGKILKGGGK